MITVKRITSAFEIVNFWSFFSEGLDKVVVRYKEPKIDKEVMFKVLCHLVTMPYNAWVGLAFVDDKPQGYGVMEETTPAFAKERSFIVRNFYNQSEGVEITQEMVKAFECWAKEQNIKKYNVTTRRISGGAIRCFESSKYGFKRAFFTFEKEIT